MNGPEHYREAERLLTGIAGNAEPRSQLEAMTDHNTVLAAQVHATLAFTAAYAESAESRITGYPMVNRPHSGDEDDPPYFGNLWGRALYGDLKETTR